MGRYADYPSLKGRYVFITGGATGIDAALTGLMALAERIHP
jgi:NAD(P)-dependent dehydrogenase (short-subunit alcohol dehydrogenase family)